MAERFNARFHSCVIHKKLSRMMWGSFFGVISFWHSAKIKKE